MKSLHFMIMSIVLTPVETSVTISGRRNEAPLPDPLPCDCGGRDLYCEACIDGLVFPEVDYDATVTVMVGDRRVRLHDSLKLRTHSPTGFAWGYGGSGPSQLALGILFTLTGDPDEALRWYQQFKSDVLVSLLQGEWEVRLDFAQWKWHRETGEGDTGVEFVRGHRAGG